MERRQYLIVAIAVISLAVLIGVLVKKGNPENVEPEHAGTESGSDSNETGGRITVTRLDKLTNEDNKELLDAYKNMKERNPDFAGYVLIEGTEMAYPVMYTPEDPEKYIHKDIYGDESDEGLPFIDTRCSIDPDSDNIIVYGHNMKDGSMFASLISYQDKAYFDAHPVIRYDTVDEIREYEVMSVFYDRVYYTDETDVFKFYDFIDAKDEDDYDRAVGEYLKKSVYDTGITAKYGDKLLTLVTCAYHTDNGRFVVVARRKTN